LVVSFLGCDRLSNLNAILFSSVLLVCCLTSVIGAYNRQFFCDNSEKLCGGPDLQHSGCGEGKWAEGCGSERTLVPMTDEFKEFLLDLHNKARSQAATGKLGYHFGKATRMATIQWDSTLAKFAQNNAKKCTMHHSDCLNTPEYKKVGQNVGFRSHFNEFLDEKEVATSVMKGWISEYKKATPESIRSTPADG
jgi:Cysteine-rich secretory protein family